MSLFGAIVKAFVKNTGNFGSGLVGVPIAGDIVVDAWDNWHREADERQRKAELENYARQRMDEAVAEAMAVVQREAPQLTADWRAALVQYLAHVPASIRRSLRRPADHTGTTVPAGLALRSANDLLPFLPSKLPRFKPGDKPLTNSDLELVELLGQGGFGEVWKARHLDRPKLPPVALKFCLDSAAARSLERERDLLDHVASAGKHDRIVQLLYTHLRADPPCLEYECVEGGDLTGVFAELHANGLPSAELVAKVVLKLAKIVAFAHGQSPAIVHRDLKPANILVRRRDGKLAFKIADFGIGGLWAKEALHKLHTGKTKPSERKLDTVLGAYTPLYASPEQMGGDPPHPRDDVHALGIIWFQLQTGRLALMSLPSDWRDDLVAAKMPGPLLDLLASCIGRQERRPKDAGALAERLAKALPTGDTTTSPQPAPAPIPVAMPVSAPPRVVEPVPRATARPSPARGFTLFWLVSVLVGFLVCGGVITGLVLFTPSPRPPIVGSAGTGSQGGASNSKNFTYQNGPLGMQFVKLPKGTFWMSKDGNNAQVQETIKKDFELAAFTVTQEQWQAVMGNNPSYFSRQGDGKDKVQFVSDADLKLFPVEMVDCQMVEDFLVKLNAREKGGGWTYRLPTEAEWEYACRGGATSKQECSFDFYLSQPTNDLSSEQANFNGEFPGGNALKGKYLQRTAKVGSYPPNKLGLYDMNGNVWQWCADLYNGGPDRVVRGGGWRRDGQYCRAARRDGHAASNWGDDFGFRVSRDPSGS